MARVRSISWQTRRNWLIDAAVFVGALLAVLTGIYFLYLPSGGYQGGRNALYGINILFDRRTWSDIHTWSGVLMILAVAVHFTIHWHWVKMMSRRIFRTLRGRGSHFSKGAKVNLVVDLIIALGFLAAAVSGIYLLFLPAGHQGVSAASGASSLIFTRATWDLIHSWAAVIMTMAAALHFVIHWRWIVNVTRRFFRKPLKAPKVALQN